MSKRPVKKSGLLSSIKAKLVILVLSLTLSTLLILSTNTGLKLILFSINHFSSIRINIQTISGNLFSKIDIQQLNVQSNSASISAKQLSLHWQPNIFNRQLIGFKAITGNDIKITFNDQKTNTNKQSIKPVPIAIRYYDFNNLTIINNQKFITQLKQLSGHIDLNQNSIHLLSKTVFEQQNLPNITINANGQYGQVNASLSLQHKQDSDFKLTAKQHKHQWDIKTVNNQLLNGTFSLAGKLTLGSQPEWNVLLAAKKIQPNLIAPAFQSNVINLTASSAGTTQNYNIIIKQLTGQVFNQDLTAKIASHFNRTKITKLNSNIQLGSAQLQTTGEYNHLLNFNWHLAINNLQQFDDSKYGKINLNGQLSGTLTKPHIYTTLNLTGIQLNHLKIDNLSSIININLTPKQPSNISIQASNVIYRDLLMNNINLKADGLSRNNQQMDIRLNQLNIDSPTLNNWQLLKHSRLLLRNKRLRLEPICLIHNQQQLCLNGHYLMTNNWKASLVTKALDAKVITDILASKLKIKGLINSKTEMNQSPTQGLNVNSNLTFGPTTITNNPSDQSTTKTYLTFKGGTLLTTFNRAKFNLKLNLKTNPTPLDAQLTINQLDAHTSQQTIKGHITWQSKTLSWLSLINPQLESPTGLFDTDLTLKGTVKQPLIYGNLDLKQFSTKLPQLGIALHNSSLNINASGRQVITQASLKSQDGYININGKSDAGQSINNTFDIQGNHFQIINTPFYKIWINPNLKINNQGNNLTIQGQIVVPEARLMPTHIANTVSLPSDTIITDADTTLSSPYQFNLFSKISVKLSDQVYIELDGLRGFIPGELTLTDHPNQPTLANGHLNIIKGSYQVFGKTLTLEKASLTYFNSPVDNPSLDINAMRIVTPQQTSTSAPYSKINVGIKLQGTLTHPKTQLYSIPAGLNQGDILSYLLTNQPAEQNNSQNLSLLLNAAESLNVGGAQGISKVRGELMHHLGLSSIELESTMAESQTNGNGNGSKILTPNTSLVLGKYLSPRLYINYSIGLLDPINTFKAKYQLNTNWAVQTDTSKLGSGVDLLFEF